MFKSKVIYKKILFLLCSLFIITFYFYGIYKYYILLQQSQQNINILQKQNNIVTNTIKEQRNKIIELTNENNELVLKNEQITAQYNDVTNKDIRTYLGEFTLTYYCISGTTASGHPTIENVTVAVDPTVIPLDSALYIDGIGVRIAHDTGGVIKGNKIDVYVSDYETAIQNGVTKNVDVWLIQ